MFKGSMLSTHNIADDMLRESQWHLVKVGGASML